MCFVDEGTIFEAETKRLKHFIFRHDVKSTVVVLTSHLAAVETGNHCDSNFVYVVSSINRYEKRSVLEVIAQVFCRYWFI